MDTDQRKVTLHTADKVYSGFIDIGNSSLRTIDIFNSANLYWKNPAEKSFDDALLLRQASILLQGNVKFGEFDMLQLRLSDIILFYDSLQTAGDNREKMRASTLKAKTGEEMELVQIITNTQGNGFYYLTGAFHGLFKSKSKQRYIPITEASVTEVLRVGNSWQKKKVMSDGAFIGVSTQHIESCKFSVRK